ncbi:g1578 [Coccomyxa viridis]|uniref:G1578 protein n=1 Tax=Coccomyxa viridis TaxID=1274662 RepID=A0ABP1FID4_9CHLO
MLLVQIALFSAAGGFLYGYDLALISGALSEIRDHFNLSEALEEAIVGAAKIGAFFGTFLGGALMLHYGRRIAIALNSVFYTLGPLTMALAPNASVLLLGRLVVGLGIGLSAVVTPAYLGEISPAHLRGRIVESYEILLCIGMLLSAGMDVALGSNWRWMVGLPGILGLVLSAALFILPESPRWLVVNNRLDEALSVIRRVYMSAGLANEDVEQELMELWSNVEKEKAARQELTSIRVTRQAGHRPTDAADQFAIDQQAAAGMSISTGFAYEATPLKDSSVDATAGNTGKGLCDKGEHAAQPVDSEAQVTYASAESHQMPDCHGSSMAGEDAHIHSKKPGVEKGCRETGGVPGNGSKLDLGGATHDVHALEGSGKGDDRQSLLEAQPLTRDLSRSAADQGPPSSSDEFWSIPQGLSPVRTQMWSDQSTGSKNSGFHRKCGIAALRQSLCHLWRMLDLGGFWKAQKQIILDIWVALHGNERRAVRMALWIALIDQAMGSTAVVNYAPQLLERAGVQTHALATAWSSSISAAKLTGVLVSLWCVDSLGRRPLMVWGGVGCSISLLLLTVGDAQRSIPLILFAMCTFLFAFSASYAAVFWVLCAELFSMAVKAPASSAAMAVLFATGAVANLLFLSLHTWLHSAAFLVFAIIAGCGTVYVHLNLPETKGISLAAIQGLMQEECARGEKPGGLEGSPAPIESTGRWDSVTSAVQARLSWLFNRYSRFIAIEV